MAPGLWAWRVQPFIKLENTKEGLGLEAGVMS